MSEEVRVHDSITQAAVNAAAGSEHAPPPAKKTAAPKKAAPAKAAPAKAVVAKAQTAEVKGSATGK